MSDTKFYGSAGVSNDTAQFSASAGGFLSYNSESKTLTVGGQIGGSFSPFQGSTSSPFLKDVFSPVSGELSVSGGFQLNVVTGGWTEISSTPETSVNAGLNLGGVGVATNISSTSNNIGFNIGPRTPEFVSKMINAEVSLTAGVEYSWETGEIRTSGTKGYTNLEGVGPILTSINGKDIPNALDKAYVMNDVYSGNYINFNKNTTPLLKEFQSDIRRGMNPYEAREKLLEKLNDLQNHGFITFKKIPIHIKVSLDYYNSQKITMCFDRNAKIKTTSENETEIGDIHVGSIVLSFDPTTNNGRGALVPKKVTRTFTNITEEWLRLTWTENGELKELVTTPGHEFLTAHGGFKQIERLVAGGTGTVVLADGSEAMVSAERIVYSAETAEMFEQAEGYVLPQNGSLALKPEFRKGWKTYNFEVEDFHTYVAGGTVRQSGLPAGSTLH